MEKSYTIPIKDISADTFRQTVVDREPGLYIGHPTTALGEDGQRIVTVYPKCHGNGQLVVKISKDGGLTWSEPIFLLPRETGWLGSVPLMILSTEEKGSIVSGS